MKPGDIVKFINEVGEGKVLRIVGPSVFVEDEHGFEQEFLKEDIFLKDPDFAKLVGNSVYKNEATESKISKRHAKHHKLKWQVDLHIHELLDNPVGMSNFQMLEYQLKYAAQKLKEAERKRIKYVVLIHGKGTGKLKLEIQQMLNKLGYNNYYDTQYDGGKTGATEVEIY